MIACQRCGDTAGPFDLNGVCEGCLEKVGVSPTPARIAATLHATEQRDQVRELLQLGIGLFQKFDLLTYETPITTELETQLRDAVASLRTLNVGIAALIAQVPLGERRGGAAWRDVREWLHRSVRAARWLWAQEAAVHQLLEDGQWFQEERRDLTEAVVRLERLAVRVGYPTTTTTTTTKE